MNKKQEALRRGLRSFIEDTSRELADLEGRGIDPSQHPVERVDGGASGAPQTLAPPTAKPSETQQVLPDRARPAPTPPPSVDAQTEAPSAAVSEPETGESAAVAPPEGPAPVVERATPAGRPMEIAPPPDDGVARRTTPPAKSRRRPQGSVRRRPRAGAGIGSNGVRAEQANTRRGVCFAYFLNHECWRVPDAYCNSALQVCITRECPVYHLHKETLERRFARKFTHFW